MAYLLVVDHVARGRSSDEVAQRILNFPQRAEGGFFEEPTGASERHGGSPVDGGEVTRNEPCQLIDLENLVRHVRGEEARWPPIIDVMVENKNLTGTPLSGSNTGHSSTFAQLRKNLAPDESGSPCADVLQKLMQMLCAK